MYKYCPHCGKPFLEPDKPRTVGLVSQVKEFITWAQIKEWSDLRTARDRVRLAQATLLRMAAKRRG